jgi:hypothetical protein
MLFTSESAKLFLLSKFADQAVRDGVALDETERRMFLFSEASGSPDYETREVFDRDYISKAYESKIARLLQRAYARDMRVNDARREWKDALSALRHEDFYGLVIVDLARIPRSQDTLWQFELTQLPFQVVELAVMALGFLVVFRPEALHLRLPDWIRWLAYPLFVWLFLYIGRVSSRIRPANSAKRSRP